MAGIALEVSPANAPQPLKKKRFLQHHKNGVLSQNALAAVRRSLPIFSARDRLIQELKKSPTVIVIGETASGKTTQIPQFLLKAGLGKTGCIACTQPRRVAAITIAQRVSAELNVKLGEEVGYCVRFEDCTNEKTRIKYMTDGMLLRESLGDSLLSRYSSILLDEAHERTVHTDVLFGIVKDAQKSRKEKGLPSLRIIIMSATMDVDHFSKYFNKSPVLYLEGRLHKIDILYTEEKQSDYLGATLVTIFQIHQESNPQEDILVFLTGQEEIESMCRTIKDLSISLPSNLPKLLIYPLYASLPKHQQLKAFHATPQGARKIVLATNIAETSVTIKGIKYVIDTGRVKAKSFLPSTGLDILAVQKISKAQAWQRAGRAGRECPGTVYRLYTEEEYSEMDEMTKPEILRCNLSSVILQLMAIGITDVQTFDFMDPPPKESIEDALNQLQILGAISKKCEYQLTDLGWKMSVFPLDPKLSRIILASTAADRRCTEEAISLVALLSVDSILYVPHGKREEAHAAKQKFVSSEGDHIMLLNIYNSFKKYKGDAGWCYDNFIITRNLNMAGNIRRQLRDLCIKAGIKDINSNRTDMAQLRKSVASGMFVNAAELQHDGTYKALSTGQTVQIHPSSCLFRCKPAYVIYNELIYTSKCYIRDLCVIDPEWLFDAAPEYFRRRLKIE
uniref:ATP-dependent RNA helicase DHX33-like n=1 Tax=Styela clava TaxID=7725 RepID=UPI00193ACE4C|nr:ATP-dependent RNA helicase DHX33-like [Styela clava]